MSDGKIDFSVEAENEDELYLKAIYFPRAFNALKYDAESSYTVDPMRQGFILPDNFKQNKKQITLTTKYWRKVNTGDAYLPLWGRVCGKKGYSAIIDEAYDSTLFSCFGKNHTFLTTSNFMSSLGKLAYKRTVHYAFYDECDYNTIAKDFSALEEKKGNLIKIDEKIKSNPNVSYLIGAPVIHWRIYSHVSEKCKLYKNGDRSVMNNTFYETIDKFKEFYDCGLKKAYVHTDGWGARGYDNLHPYILPPCKDAGGYEGMRALSDTCRELGYRFGLHDQYRDYYQDSPVYDENKCVIDVNGNKSYCDIWAGGPHNWLCSEYYMQFVKRTYDELAENGVKVDGTYLDVFSIMWGDECYDKRHPMTRKKSIEKRGECFDMLRERGIIVSSEEAGAQMVKYLDLVHHAPYAVTPQGGGVGVGISVPLTNLVYHDCFFVPWHIEGKGGWGIPDGDSGFLHCVLNGQTPYFNNSMAEFGKEEKASVIKRVEKVKEACAVNELVYNAELIKHEFLDGYRKQKATYSNGVTVTVDFDNDTYTVEKP